MKIKNVVVIGSGTMGSGIAAHLCNANVPVTLLDLKTEISEKAELLKELLKSTKDNIKEEELRIQAVNNANKRIQKNIEEIESRSKAWNKNKSDKVNALQNSLDF